MHHIYVLYLQPQQPARWHPPDINYQSKCDLLQNIDLRIPKLLTHHEHNCFSFLINGTHY
ncbi:hypothetical protein BON22_1893 [Cyberlindnera fabianii]|uniref:Uncharacterized protein n=1 Tax=Cyberlindnera fabianii TaxID=36022 RepID=A0A1V2L919_CYBFA|nr:hypothetical protein BON22_1893 [Cyberlindnera fabianii]